METKDVQEFVAKELAAARTHHVTLNYLTLGLLCLTLVLGSWFYARQQQSFEAALSKADAHYSQWMQDEKARDAAYQQHEDERDAALAQQNAIARSIESRDAAAQKTIADVTAPTKTAVEVAADAEKYLQVTPEVNSDKLAFTPHDVQGFIKTQVDGETCQQDLSDTKHTLDLEKASEATLRADLAAANKSVQEGKGVATDYKKVAKKSWLRRVVSKSLDVAEKVGLLVVGVKLGSKL